MRELRPGLFHWTTFHEGIGAPVCSYYVEPVGALIDALMHYGETLSFVPDGLIGDDPEGVKTGLTDAFRGLLERDFEDLLFAHGDPIVGGGQAALRRFIQ